MNCIHCGKALAEDSSFCPYCGKSQEITEKPKQIAPIVPADPFSGKCHPSVKRNIVIACAAVGAATLLGIILVVFCIFFAVFQDIGHIAPWENEIIAEEGIGNTSDNIRYDGNAANGYIGDDAFYIDGDRLLYRDIDGFDSEITYSIYGFYYYLNRTTNYLYYLEYEEGYNDWILRCDPDTGFESYLYESEEDIYYFTIIGQTAYFVTEEAVYSADLEFEEVTELFTVNGEGLDVSFTENGIYYLSLKKGESTLYRRDLDGKNQKEISKCINYSINGEDLYTLNINEDSGKEEIYHSDLLGEESELIYTFDQSGISQIDSFLAKDGIIYCTIQRIGDNSEGDSGQRFEICTLNTNTKKLSTIVSNRSAKSMPYYGLNLAGQWLFYWDDTNPYHIQSILLEQTDSKSKEL